MRNDERVTSDGHTVWVHDDRDGSCIGRFGRMGIDIHRPVFEQAEHGQCLMCTHGPTGPAEWDGFVEGMSRHYGIAIHERHRPGYITPEPKEKTVEKIKTYVVTGVHHIVPGSPVSVQFSQAAADRAALDLVCTIAADVDGAPEMPADPSQWRAYLTEVQRLIVTSAGGEIDGTEDEDRLADLADADVTIAIVETDAPRVVVSLEGGLVQGAVGDIPLDMYVIDYDTDGADEERLIAIPQDDGDTSEATMRGETVKVDPLWIDGAVEAYHAHDAASTVVSA